MVGNVRDCGAQVGEKRQVCLSLELAGGYDVEWFRLGFWKGSADRTEHFI